MIYSKLMIDRSVRSGLGSVEYAYRYDGITNIVVTVTTNAHHRFVYDGYLCIQRLIVVAMDNVGIFQPSTRPSSAA